MGQGQGREGIAPRATHSPRPRHQGQDRPHSPFGLPGIAGGSCGHGTSCSAGARGRAAQGHPRSFPSLQSEALEETFCFHFCPNPHQISNSLMF